MPKLTRRHFVTSAAAAAVVSPNLLLGQAKGANSRVRLGVMGLSRGRGHIKALRDVANAEVAYVCDVDSNRLAAAAKSLADDPAHAGKPVADYRTMLEDSDLDAITIAAPNFWHAPATIQGCRAGKHVYVEKPGSYNVEEAQRMVEVAAETDRKVQMGTQRRSYPALIEGVEKLNDGIIGKLHSARTWYTNARGSIGKGSLTDPPAELDWTLWQGPVPDAPYKDNLVHYNWHWHWKYGGGEMANNGVHALDVALWAMGITAAPARVTCGGGRYHFDDDQETPDTAVASFDFGDQGISWNSSSSHRRKPAQIPFVTVYGEGGKWETSGKNYVIYDLDGKEIARNDALPSDVPHFENFVDAIRNDTPLNQPIAQGQRSSLLCHYGNIAYRTTGAVEVDSKTERVVAGHPGESLQAREAYREGFGI